MTMLDQSIETSLYRQPVWAEPIEQDRGSSRLDVQELRSLYDFSQSRVGISYNTSELILDAATAPSKKDAIQMARVSAQVTRETAERFTDRRRELLEDEASEHEQLGMELQAASYTRQGIANYLLSHEPKPEEVSVTYDHLIVEAVDEVYDGRPSVVVVDDVEYKSINSFSDQIKIMMKTRYNKGFNSMFTGIGLFELAQVGKFALGLKSMSQEELIQRVITYTSYKQGGR